MSGGGLRFNGALLLLLAALLAVMVVDWQIGGEFWLSVLGLCILGVLMIGERDMHSFRAAILALAAMGFCVWLAVAMLGAITDPAYQGGLTARYEARQQTEQVQAREWGATARTGLMWGGGALAACVVAGAGGWAVVEWQRERSKRHTTSAQERVVLAYIAQYGGRAGELDGESGVFLDASGEFVPWQVARAELPATALLTVDA